MQRIITAVCLLLASSYLAGCTGASTPPMTTQPSNASSVGQPAGSSPQSGVREQSAANATAATTAFSFSDNFASDKVGGTDPNFTRWEGSWIVCSVDGHSNEYCAPSANTNLTVAGSSNWADYTVDAFVVDSDVTTGGAAIVGRLRDQNNFYQLELRKAVGGTSPMWYLWRDRNATWTPLASGVFRTNSNPYYHLRIVFSGSTITTYVAYDYGSDYELLGSATDATFATGRIALRSFDNAGIRFDGVNVTGSMTGGATAAPAPTEAPKPAATATPKAVATATAPLPPNVSAVSADDFVGSMGADLDLVTLPSSQVPAISNLFKKSGMRHARISVLEHDPDYYASVNTFFSANPTAHAFGTTDCSPPLGRYPKAVILPSDLAEFQAATGNRVDGVESINEPDDQGDTNWVRDTKACMEPFVGHTAGVPVLAPALIIAHGADQQAFGNADSLVQEGNIHRYYAGRDPGNPGYGSSDACGKYGSLTWIMCWARVTTPNEPLNITETGWNTQKEVDEPTQGKYVSRVFFVDREAGISATSIFNFLGYDGGDGFGGDGLLRPDMSPKPAFTAISNITALLSDAGAAYAPAALPLAVSPAPVASGEGLRSMLLGKRDGSYYLALWQEVPSANPNAYGSDYNVPAVNVTVSLGTNKAGTLHAWQNDGSAPASSLGTKSSFVIPVADRMTIVELRNP